MEQHVGSEFDGTISGVTSFGLFVELDESKVNGLVTSPIAERLLPLRPDPQDAVRRTRRPRFRLGDRVRIVVLKASLEERKIDSGWWRRRVRSRCRRVGSGERSKKPY